MKLTALSWTPLGRSEPALTDLTLEIPGGQRVLLAGASGSGKSTLLRALAGLLDPETGDLSGVAPAPTRPGERGLLLQNPVHALVAASIGRDAAFGPENAAVPRAEIHARAAAALDAAAVDLDSSRAPLDASGGQQQRIALAGALALAPDALLLDEPTSMLDASTAAVVRTAVLAATGPRTLVVADHDVHAWLPHMDRVIVLGDHGRIVADGSPGQVGELLAGPPRSAPRVPPRPGAIVAELRSVSVSRPGAAQGEPPILQDLDLVLSAGTLSVVTGRSGSGKTTLLRALSGLMTPSAGTVRRPPRGALASVPQNPEHSFVATSVRAEVLASPFADDESLADDLLARAGLAQLADANPYRLSGGEQRRLAIVAALAQRPRLLILDEPTVGLDPARRKAVMGLLDEAIARGCAVIAASHDPHLISRADTRIKIGKAGPDNATPHRPDRTVGPIPRRPRIPADALNPLTLSLIGILAAIGSFGVSTWQGGLLALLPIVLLAPLAVRSVRAAVLRLAPIIASAAGLAWTTALLGDAPSLSGEAWLVGAKEAARITVFVAPGVLALGSVDPTALGDALGGRLRLPARPVAASVVALVRAGHLGRQWQQIIQARVLRGIGSPASPRLLAGATLALLVDTLRSAEHQALAMDSRGFHCATRRTWALPSPLGLPDLFGVAIGIGLLIWPWMAEGVVGWGP